MALKGMSGEEGGGAVALAAPAGGGSVVLVVVLSVEDRLADPWALLTLSCSPSRGATSLERSALTFRDTRIVTHTHTHGQKNSNDSNDSVL